jgi:hypothetical protein
MRIIFTVSFFSLLLIGGWQELRGGDIKSAIVGEWRYENGTPLRLSTDGSFKKDEIKGKYSFISDSLVRFEYIEKTSEKETGTKAFVYRIRELTDKAMVVEQILDDKSAPKETFRFRRPTPEETNRSTVIADLQTLGAKSQQFFAFPSSRGGGGESFVELTADSAGLAILASTAFTNNVNGTYTIKTAGRADEVVLRGVGKVKLEDGSFPIYDVKVKASSMSVTKVN